MVKGKHLGLRIRMVGYGWVFTDAGGVLHSMPTV